MPCYTYVIGLHSFRRQLTAAYSDVKMQSFYLGVSSVFVCLFIFFLSTAILQFIYFFAIAVSLSNKIFYLYSHKKKKAPAR